MTGLIILLCRNNVALSTKCLKTLLAQTVKPDILIVDNASTDGTASWARSQAHKDPRVWVMTLRGHLGAGIAGNGHPTESLEPFSVARAWNVALRWAWNKGMGEALVVNNDTELRPETYQSLHDYLLQNRRVGLATCVGVGSRKQFEEPWKEQIRPHPDYSCWMIKRWAHQNVPFDEGYKGAYCEDSDHHVRLFRAGIGAVCIGLPFLHHAAGTLKTASAEEKRRIESNAAKNRQRFFETYGAYPGTKGYERLFSAEGEESTPPPRSESRQPE